MTGDRAAIRISPGLSERDDHACPFAVGQDPRLPAGDHEIVCDGAGIRYDASRPPSVIADPCLSPVQSLGLEPTNRVVRTGRVLRESVKENSRAVTCTVVTGFGFERCADRAIAGAEPMTSWPHARRPTTRGPSTPTRVVC